MKRDWKRSLVTCVFERFTIRKKEWFVVTVSLSYLSPHSRLHSDPVSPSDDPGEPSLPTGISRSPLGELHLSPRQTTGSFPERIRLWVISQDLLWHWNQISIRRSWWSLRSQTRSSAAAAPFSKWFSTVFDGVSDALLKLDALEAWLTSCGEKKAGWSPIRSSEIAGRPSACLEQRFQSATYTSCLGVHHVRAQLLWINHVSDFISPPLWCYCTLGRGSLPFFFSGVAA